MEPPLPFEKPPRRPVSSAMTPFGIHAAGQHVAVVAIAGDHLVAFLGGHLHADDDGFLPDIEVAEAADQAHAVHLAGLLLEAADQQHLAIGVEILVLGKLWRIGGGFLGRSFGGALGAPAFRAATAIGSSGAFPRRKL